MVAVGVLGGKGDALLVEGVFLLSESGFAGF